jgi:hypothetical protein
VRHDINVDCASGFVVTGLNGASELHHILDSVGFQQVFVVKVIEEEVQSPLGIVDLCLEGGGGSGLDTLHVF